MAAAAVWAEEGWAAAVWAEEGWAAAVWAEGDWAVDLEGGRVAGQAVAVGLVAHTGFRRTH